MLYRRVISDICYTILSDTQVATRKRAFEAQPELRGMSATVAICVGVGVVAMRLASVGSPVVSACFDE